MKAQILIVVALAASAWSHPKTFEKVVPPVHAKHWQSARIVGGNEVTPHSIPYQVALDLKGYFCGGSLISPNWVLTAGHCGVLTQQPTCILGAHNVQQTESTQQVIPGDAPKVHPQYNPNTLHNDVSLIRLQKSATLNNNVATVVLAGSNAGNYVNNNVRSSGWGKPSDNAGSISSVLRAVINTVMTNEDCAKTYGSTIYDGNICTKSDGGHGTCSGDSGGPLVDTNSNTQVGVTSFVATAGCESGLPDGFSRVSYFADWIRQNSN